jgi:hypothetical protein
LNESIAFSPALPGRASKKTGTPRARTSSTLKNRRWIQSTQEGAAHAVAKIVIAIDDGLMLAGEVLAHLAAMKALFLPDAGALQPQGRTVSGLAREYRLFKGIALFARFALDRLRRRIPLGIRPAHGTHRHHAGAAHQYDGNVGPILQRRKQ